MNTKSGYILIAVLIVIAAAMLIPVVIGGDNTSEIVTVNKDITRTIGFSVNSDSADLDTSATGTIFLRGSGDLPEEMRIVARIEIDPDDWGGVSFCIPAGWHVSGITSSYPEKDTQAEPADYITTLTTADPDYEWKTMVEIGRGRGYTPTGGGTGTVVIDLVPDRDATHMPGTFDIMVAVSSGEKDGVKILGTDFIEIPVLLTDE